MSEDRNGGTLAAHAAYFTTPGGGAARSCLEPPSAYVKLQQERAKWAENRASFEAWLAKTPEKALEPDLEIVDCHHHLWDMRMLQGHNPWGIFKQQYYLTDELVDDLVGGGHRVCKSVFVTTHAFFAQDGDPLLRPLGEVRFVDGVASQFASGKYGPIELCAGIVGSCDLQQCGAEAERFFAEATKLTPRFKGIRVTAAFDAKMGRGNFAPGPGMLLDPKFREGFACLQRFGLTCDVFVYSSQLPDVIDLAEAFPEQVLVLNHIGMPCCGFGDVASAPEYAGQQQAILQAWREQMRRLARCPQVFVKLGGAGFPQAGHGFELRAAPPGSAEVAELYREPYLWVVETFGAHRCMLEGNFPVDKVSMSYTVLWNALKLITAGLPAEDRARLFHGSAAQVYRL